MTLLNHKPPGTRSKATYARCDLRRSGGAILYCALFALAPYAWPSGDHLRTAAELINRGDLDGAEKESRLALQDPATRAAAFVTLGTIRLQQKRLDEGIDFLQKAIRLDSHLVGARISLGVTYAMQGRRGPAAQMFREALRSEPGNFNARLDLAQIESEDGQFKDSLDTARPVSSELRRSPEGLLLLATDYGGLHEKDQLSALITDWQSLAEPPESASIDFASILLKGGLPQQGPAILETAVREGMPSFELSLALAQAYQAVGDFKRASAAYETALGVKGDCLACLMGIAATAEKLGATEKALSYLIKARMLQPENPEVLFRLGKVCLARDLFDDAVEFLKKASSLQPGNDTYAYVLASAHVGRKEFKEARTIFESLLKKHPSDPALNYALGSAMFLDQELDGAETYLKRSIELQPRQRPAYYYLSQVAERRGDDAVADSILRDLVRRNPDYALAYEALGSLLLRRRQYAEAEEVLERAVSLDPNSVSAHYQLGMVLGRTGKQEESRRQLEFAQKLGSMERAQNELQLHLLLPEQAN